MSAFATLGSPPCSAKNCWAARVSIWISTPFPTSGKTSSSSTTTCPNGVAARNRFWSFWLRTPIAKWSAIPAPTSTPRSGRCGTRFCRVLEEELRPSARRAGLRFPPHHLCQSQSPESDGRHFYDPTPPLPRFSPRNRQSPALGLAHRAPECSASHLSDTQDRGPAHLSQPVSGPTASVVHRRVRSRATYRFTDQRSAHFRRQADYSLRPTHVDRKLVGRLCRLLSLGRAQFCSGSEGGF